MPEHLVQNGEPKCNGLQGGGTGHVVFPLPSNLVGLDS